MSRLVVVSNRVAKPSAASGSQGGLAVGVFAAMEESGGVWFGWNGKISNTESEIEIDKRGDIEYITLSLKKNEYNQYYKGFANSVLWPLFHHRPDLMKYQLHDFNGYAQVNNKFAENLLPLLRDDDILWIHDYHLIPLAKALRAAGLKIPIGFFLHTPFPPFDLFRGMPRYRDVLKELLHYDLVGFQTETDAQGFRESVRLGLGGQVEDKYVTSEGRTVRYGVYPIGVETDLLPGFVDRGKTTVDYANLKGSLANRKLIVGVDRLDYSKGIENRFLAYEKLLQAYPEFLKQLVYLQISPTSRGDVQAYGDFAKNINRAAGHVIGTYADFDWMPLRYLNRGFRRNTILAMYNLAAVGFVTPLRDGMNLVAKEYVVAQTPENPGVLVLSKMAGAAAELDAAVIVNPYDIDAVAKRLNEALIMPLDERVDRWKRMMNILRKNNIHAWHESFLKDLHSTVTQVFVKPDPQSP